MKGVKKLPPVNRCFGNSCPQKPEKEREQQIRDALESAAKRRLANKQIDILLSQFRGKQIIDLLPLIKFRYPHILAVALARIERKKYEPGSKDAIFLAEFKRSLDRPLGQSE